MLNFNSYDGNRVEGVGVAGSVKPGIYEPRLLFVFRFNECVWCQFNLINQKSRIISRDFMLRIFSVKGIVCVC